MVGDTFNDMQAGLNAGVRAAFIRAQAAQTMPNGVLHCRDLGVLYSKLSNGKI